MARAAGFSPDNDGEEPDFPVGARELFGDARFARYLRDASGYEDAATALLLWNQTFAAVLHSQLGLVEFAVRNATDRALRDYGLSEAGCAEWTDLGQAPDLGDDLISSDVRRARARPRRTVGLLVKESSSSDSVQHDDVVAQLMWGTWIKLVGLAAGGPQSAAQQKLWRECLHNAFPGYPADDAGRKKLSSNLQYLRQVRNRAAHFDNLYREATSINRIIGTCLAVLSGIDERLAHGWIDTAGLRLHARALRNLRVSD